MERYIGLDVHSTSCTCVVISQTGRKTKEVVLETSAGALRDFVRKVRRPSVVVMAAQSDLNRGRRHAHARRRPATLLGPQGYGV